MLLAVSDLARDRWTITVFLITAVVAFIDALLYATRYLHQHDRSSLVFACFWLVTAGLSLWTYVMRRRKLKQTE
jgi:hypothetical protein